MELYYWPAQLKWGLPTFDINSLHVMSYIKFCKAPVSLFPVLKSLLNAKTRELPCLVTTSGEMYSSPKEIINYLNLKFFNPDTWLNEEQRGNIIAMTSLIEEKLLPAVMSLLWLDNQNFTEVTRMVYAKSCRYPLNFSAPQSLQHDVEKSIRISGNYPNEDFDVMCNKLFLNAVSTLNMFSEFLGDKNFLFGDRPSSLDALLFSCLVIPLKLPLLNGKLKNYLKGCSKFSQYTARIMQVYFKEELKSRDSIMKEEEDPYKYDWIFPVVVTALAMFSYAVNIKLITITR
ncbi:metaxin-1 isoform X3 [Hydra vulgaris]|uniref:Metaxin-1 isoform X3 n=1 Tax=Hydra vulgaris TaxID=6087 RepID=A0ABM4DDH7_HYDVU